LGCDKNRGRQWPESQLRILGLVETAERAMAVSREATRGLLSTGAELYANTITDKKPGEQIVKITMDDGWSVAINAPGRVSVRTRTGKAMSRFLLGLHPLRFPAH